MVVELDTFLIACVVQGGGGTGKMYDILYSLGGHDS